MRHFLLTVCVFALLSVSHGQNVINARTATVVAYWEVGDAKTYKLTRTKVGTRSTSTSLLIDMKVMAATDSTYRVEFKYHDMELLGAPLGDAEATKAIDKVTRAVDGLRVLVVMDGTGGVVQEVVNPAEIKAHCDRIIAGILDLSSDPTEREQMRDMFSALITEDALMSSALEDINYLILPFGLEYTLNKTETLPAEFPNPLGGPPLPGTMDIGMTALNATAETASIQCTQRVDPAKLNTFIKEFFASMDASVPASESRELEKMLREMKVDHNITFDLDMKGAWVRKARSRQVVVAGSSRQTDERIYELQ